jgi:hypothetical protein
MLSFEKIAEEAKAYSNLRTEEIEAMELSDLHEQLWQRTMAEAEVTASKKAFSSAAGDLLKRIRADNTCLGIEIQKRHDAENEAKRAAEAKARSDSVEVIELLPEPDGLAVVS